MANSNTSLKKHAPTSKKGPPSTLASPSSAKTKAGSATGGNTTVSKKKPPATATSTAIVISDKTAANRPIQKSVKVQDEGPSKTERREERQRRGFTVCMGVILCLILLLILGLVLGLVVFGKDDNNSTNNNNNSLESSQSSNGSGGSNGGQTPTFPMPTQNIGSPSAPAPSAATNGNSSPVAPTAESSPVTSPTLRPTTPRPVAPVAPVAPAPTSLLQPSSSQLIILPYADTFVYRNGFTPYEAYGTEDTFLVQNGPDGVNEIPDAVGLLGFDVSTLPSSYSQVVLQLYHQAASRNRGAATLTIRLLPSTPLAIETLHAGIFNPTDDEGTFGPTFNVSPSDTIVQVDITNLVRNRYDDQLFLMIENRGAEQGEGAEGDRFYTRETNDPPQLIVDV